jgi:hypothetical protein
MLCTVMACVCTFCVALDDKYFELLEAGSENSGHTNQRSGPFIFLLGTLHFGIGFSEYPAGSLLHATTH